MHTHDNFPTTAAPLPEAEALRAGCLTALEFLARGSGVELDQARAREALTQAESDLPGPWSATWAQRLTQAGRDLGLLVSSWRHPVAGAQALARQNSTLVSFAPDGDGTDSGRWLVATPSRLGYVSNEAGRTVRWAPPREVERSVPGVDGDPRLWLSSQATTPCQPLEEAPHRREHHGPSPLSRLIVLLRQDRNDFWVVFLFAVGVGVFSMATPIAVEAIVNTVQGGTQILLQPVIALSVVLLVFLGLAALLRILKAFVVEYLQQRIFVRVVIDLANRLPQVRADALDRQHGPELVNRFFDVLTVQKACSVLLVDGLTVVVQGAIGLMVLAFFNPFLLGFDLVLIGAIAFIVFVLGRGAIRTSIGESYAKYDVAAWLEELLRHPLTFKMGGGRTYAVHRANDLARGYIKARRAHFKILYRQILFALLLQAAASAALFGLGGWLVINRGLTLGQLVAAELILSMVVGSLIKLGKSLESYYDLMAGIDKLGHLIDLPLERVAGEHLPDRTRPAAVALRGVELVAPVSRRRLFAGLTAHIAPGERVAVTGPHGSGKSTLLDILYGLRHPDDGRVELDGVDLRDARPESLRSQVAVVKGQEVFEGTVADNVRVGRPIPLADVRAALDSVGLLEEVLELPGGLAAPLSTGGSPLSLGQIQRLVMARAVVGRPRLVLVDEAFDDLSEEARGRALETFLDPDAPWTLVAVTHSPEVARRFGRQLRLGPAQ